MKEEKKKSAMLMYQFHKLSAHAAHICRVQFALAFQSASSGLLCGYGFEP